MEIVGLFFGGMIFFITLIWANNKDYYTRLQVKLQRDSYSPKPIRIRSATIAEDLVPLLDKLLDKSCKISIVGSDGYYALSKNKRVWLNGLKKWLNRGVEINYILVKPNQEARSEYEKLQREFPNSFYLCSVDKPGIDDISFTGIDNEKDSYVTLHPTLVYRHNPDSADLHGKITPEAMWIEYFHPLESHYAYNIEYVSPRAMNSKYQEIFRKFEKDIELMREKCF